MIDIENYISRLLAARKAFAAWRIPGEQPIHLLEGKAEVFDPSSSRDGFVFYPFDEKCELPLLISGSETAIEAPIGHAPYPNCQASEFVEFATYEEQVKQIVGYIQGGQLQKLVLSRLVQAPGLSADKAARGFLALCQRYPHAMVYLFSDGQRMFWMGATPETLARFSGLNGETVSLAGTLRADQSQSWTTKERDEQQIVTDYILKKLHEAGVTLLDVDGPHEAIAGHLVHLKTYVRFVLSDIQDRFKVVKSLHPTPAVCGTPRDIAMQLISKIEKHKRRYYTGFLGPWATNADTHLFVNLRCMAFSSHQSCLFVGGGITMASEAAREWAETNWKAETLAWLFEGN